MEDEFYAIIKLVSGEEIFSLILVDNNEEDDTVIVLQNPVIMTMMGGNHGSFIKVKSWMELTDEDFFIIKFDKVIYITETSDKKLINIYNDFIENPYDIDTIENEVKPDSKMGYISNVNDARKKLEDDWKRPNSNKES